MLDFHSYLRRSQMKKAKKIIIWVVVIIAIIGVVMYFTRPKNKGPEYNTAKVSKADIAQTVSITGEIVPVSSADLSFEGTGTVTDVYVEVGDEVKKGDRIMEIDDSVMSSQLKEAYLELEKQTEILQQSRRTWDSLSPDEKASAKLTEEKARAAVWTLQKQIKKTTLYAPIGGTIIKKYVDEGELATITSPVVTVMGDGGFEIKAEIPESDIAKVKIGQKAEVAFDAFSSDEIFEAEVSFIEPAATLIQDVVYYETKFNIVNEERIRPGMSADIDIATAEKKNVLAVPGQAVKSKGGQKYVEVLITNENDKKETKNVDVKTGLRGDDGMVEIVSGLSEGDEVVTFVKS